VADNPWTAAAQPAANPWGKASAAKPKESPWGKALAQGAGMSRDVTQMNLERLGVPQGIDLLDRQRQALQATIRGGPGAGFHALLHHADPAEQDQNRAATRAALHLPSEAERAKQPAFERGLVDFTTDTVSDPVSYETLGIAPLLRGAGRLGELGMEAVLRTPAGRLAHDATTFAGPAKRALGPERYEAVAAADRRQQAKEAEATRILTDRFNAWSARLPSATRRQVYRILNGEEAATPALQPHVDAARTLLNDAAAIQANRSGRAKIGSTLGNARLSADMNPWELSWQKPISKMTPQERMMRMQHADDATPNLQRGPFGSVKPAAPPKRTVQGTLPRQYQIPPELQPFAAPPEQGILGAKAIRRDYLPGPRAAKAVDPDAPASEFNRLSPFTPNAISRERFAVGGPVEDFDQAMRGALAQAARQATSGRLRQEVGARLGHGAEPAVEQMLTVKTPARGTARADLEQVAQGWKNVVQIPKNVVTSFGLKHGLVNVPTLGALSEGPGAALEGLLQGAAQLRRTPAQRYAHLEPAVEGGVITPSEARQNALVDAIGRIPVLGGPLGKVSRGARDLTWSIDDATKAAVLKRKLARGIGPTNAAAQTMREMINYGQRAPLTKALGYAMPFPTYDTRLPLAIASSVARHPERVLAADRATQGLSSNGQVDVGGHRVSLTNPLSKALTLPEAPLEYGRSSAADPLKLLSTLLFPGLGLPARFSPPLDADRETKAAGKTWGTQKRFGTYGKPVLPYRDADGHWHVGAAGQTAAGYVPGGLGEGGLGLSGMGDFGPESWLDLLLGGTVGAHVR
jgi:hypothetical protein